jgi:hypothetical protein
LEVIFMVLKYTKKQVCLRAGRILPDKFWGVLEDLDTRISSAASGVLAAGSVSTAELADGAATAAKLSIFESTEQTADGTAQNIAHGFKDAEDAGVTPSIVFVELTSVPDGGASVTYTKGTANVIVTATTGAKYVVHAIK